MILVEIQAGNATELERDGVSLVLETGWDRLHALPTQAGDVFQLGHVTVLQPRIVELLDVSDLEDWWLAVSSPLSWPMRHHTGSELL
jgi:hypothetical protein